MNHQFFLKLKFTPKQRVVKKETGEEHRKQRRTIKHFTFAKFYD